MNANSTLLPSKWSRNANYGIISLKSLIQLCKVCWNQVLPWLQVANGCKISALNLKQNLNKLRSEVKFDEFFFWVNPSDFRNCELKFWRLDLNYFVWWWLRVTVLRADGNLVTWLILASHHSLLNSFSRTEDQTLEFCTTVNQMKMVIGFNLSD